MSAITLYVRSLKRSALVVGVCPVDDLVPVALRYAFEWAEVVNIIGDPVLERVVKATLPLDGR